MIIALYCPEVSFDHYNYYDAQAQHSLGSSLGASSGHSSASRGLPLSGHHRHHEKSSLKVIVIIIKSHDHDHDHDHNHHQNHHDDQADQVTVHCLVSLKALSPHLAFPGEDDDGHYGEDDDEHDGDDGDDFAP